MIKKILTSAVVISMVLVFASCSPESAAAVLPEADEIEAIQITADERSVEENDRNWISDLLALIKENGLEKEDSEHHIPESKDYITINFVFKDGDESSLYLYQEQEIWYLEVPCQGIYKLDDSIVAFIMNGDIVQNTEN